MTGEDIVEPMLPVGCACQRSKLDSLVVEYPTALEQQFVRVLHIAAIDVERQDRIICRQLYAGATGSAVPLPGKPPAFGLPCCLSHVNHRYMEAVAPGNETGKDADGMPAWPVLP